MWEGVPCIISDPGSILDRQHEGIYPTSAWNDQFTGQGQWDDGVLIDQGRKGTCGERQAGRVTKRDWKMDNSMSSQYLPNVFFLVVLGLKPGT